MGVGGFSPWPASTGVLDSTVISQLGFRVKNVTMGLAAAIKSSIPGKATYI